jgi:ABC-2 type transport system ATP-binding protein
MTEYVIEAEGLVKHFGGIRAVDGLDLLVPAGTDGGRAMVGGHDVVAEPDAVRRIIGASG